MAPMDDVSHILAPLNDAQREAVTAAGCNLLVLAGAGSGKTRVLVHRIAWLLQVERAAPWSVLAVTFTNKAAREMRQRIEDLLGQPLGGMWVGTFHGLAHRLLRAHWKEAGLPQSFQILDSDDQFRLIKRVLKSLDLDDNKWPPRQLQWFINGRKDEGLRAQHLDDGGDPAECHHRAQAAVRHCIEQECDPPACAERCGMVAHELYRDCVEAGGTPDECELKAREAFEACTAEHCQPPTCEAQCLEAGERVMAECTEAGGEPGDCQHRARAAVQNCLGVQCF